MGTTVKALESQFIDSIYTPLLSLGFHQDPDVVLLSFVQPNSICNSLRVKTVGSSVS